MKTRDDFSDYYAELLDGVYECLDRIVLNAYYPMGQSGGGMRTWWRRLHGSDHNLSDGSLRDMAGTFARRIRAHCAKHYIPFVETDAGDRKHLFAEQHRPEDPNFRGLFLVLTAKAPAPVWQVKRNDKGQITQLSRPRSWPFVKHYHFHIIDPEWGHVTIRMSGHPPFGAQVILNGHEWMERAAQKRQWSVNKEFNCFVEGKTTSASISWLIHWPPLSCGNALMSFAAGGSTRPASVLPCPSPTSCGLNSSTSSLATSWS